MYKIVHVYSAVVIRHLARLKSGNIEMKSKEKPSTQTGAYFVVRDRLCGRF